MRMQTALIEGRFRGPAGIGNGGYVAGRMTALLGAQPAVVTLRRGWPLDVPLMIRPTPAGGLAAVDAEGATVAEVRETPLDLTPPPAATRAEAGAATAWFLESPFSHSTGLCFVCGAGRPEGDGLRVFTGRVAGRPGIAAALWRPDPAFADPTGLVRPEFLWSALDCAGSFAFTVGTGPGSMAAGANHRADRGGGAGGRALRGGGLADRARGAEAHGGYGAVRGGWRAAGPRAGALGDAPGRCLRG